MVILENKTNLSIAKLRLAGCIQGEGIAPIKLNSAGRWAIQCPQDVKQRTFATSRWTGHRQGIASLHRQIQISKNR